MANGFGDSAADLMQNGELEVLITAPGDGWNEPYYCRDHDQGKSGGNLQFFYG